MDGYETSANSKTRDEMEKSGKVTEETKDKDKRKRKTSDK